MKLTGYFTGIGSRRTPLKYMSILEKASQYIVHTYQCTLRSGHAAGADRACETGAEGSAQIYLPWKNYGIKPYKDDPGMEVIGETIIPSKKKHPYITKIAEFMCDLVGERSFNDMSSGVQLLMLRNVNQLIGHNENHVEPIEISRIVLCFSLETGGTGYATALAKYLGVPIINVLNKNLHEVLTEINERLPSSPMYSQFRITLLKEIYE